MHEGQGVERVAGEIAFRAMVKFASRPTEIGP